MIKVLTTGMAERKDGSWDVYFNVNPPLGMLTYAELSWTTETVKRWSANNLVGEVRTYLSHGYIVCQNKEDAMLLMLAFR